MVAAPCDTFNYEVIVPDTAAADGFETTASSRDLRPQTGDEILDNRLAGWSPRVRVEPAGPDAQRMVRSRITFSATDRTDARVAAFSVDVDPFLTSHLKPRDQMTLVRLATGGLGLSVLRNEELVVAAGAVTRVPLGRGVRAETAYDLSEKALAVFRKRDPEFCFHRLAVEVWVEKVCAILYEGKRQIGPVGIFADHDESVGIWRTPLCSELAARLTAKWLREWSYESGHRIVQW